MKTYRISPDDIAMEEHEDGEWVPASVAQALYDELKWIRDNYPNRGPDGYPNIGWLERTNAALVAADKEER